MLSITTILTPKWVKKRTINQQIITIYTKLSTLVMGFNKIFYKNSR